MGCLQHSFVKKLLLSAQSYTCGTHAHRQLRPPLKVQHSSTASMALSTCASHLNTPFLSGFNKTKSNRLITRETPINRTGLQFPNPMIHSLKNKSIVLVRRRFPSLLLYRKYLSHHSNGYTFAANFTFSRTNALLWHYKQARSFHHTTGNVRFSESTHTGDHRDVHVEDQPPSWLFVSAAIAGVYGAQVNVELGLDERLTGEGLETLRANLKSRGLSVNIDGLQQKFKDLMRMKQEKAALLLQRDEVLQQMKLLKETTSSGDPELTKEKLAEKLRDVKAQIKALKSSWDLEESVMLEALRLPNDLHPLTPLNKTKVMRELKAPTEAVSILGHVDIARKYDLIKFSNVGPKAYYLKRELVAAEMALTSTVCDFLRSRGYRHISGPEFVKTPVIEGCGGDVRDYSQVLTMIDPHKTTIEPMNHLTGVSQHMFAAYVAKTCIGDSVLPLRMFACGRNYRNSDLPGLFGAIQSTQADVFSCVREEDVEQQFENNVDLVWDFLKQFGFALRLNQVSAMDLRREQRRRVDVEMYSPNLQQFLPVGSVSDLGDFISRRLMVTHNQNHADIRTAKRVHMIHGTVLNITSFLALWMEHSTTDKDEFKLCHLPPLTKS